MQKNAKFSRAGGNPPRPPFSGGWGLRPQSPKTDPQCEFLPTPLLSVLVCYARVLLTSIRTAFSNITYIYHSIPLQERLFSSCTYQKRKHEIKGKFKTDRQTDTFLLLAVTIHTQKRKGENNL